MKKLIFVLYSLGKGAISFGQQVGLGVPLGDHLKVVKDSLLSNFSRIELRSDIDSTWDKWSHRGYSFGFNPAFTPMYTTVEGIISTPYMIQVRGNEDETNKKRWGYHVFEGYAKDDKSRITMLVNKHIEEDKPVAEMYYFGTVYNHSEPAYHWFRIGSDVRNIPICSVGIERFSMDL